MIDCLKKYADNSDILLDENQLNKFNIFYDMLIETNKHMNLTAITDMKEVVLKHFIDSIYLSKYYDFSGKKVIDVGTGAGFPGVPLAIFFENAEFVLMDSLNKRLKFINEVCDAAGIHNITTVHGRAEDIARMEEYRENFDYCVSRAVAPLPVLLELCSGFIKVEGKFISYKSELLEDELNISANALKKLNCGLEKKIEYTIPDTDYYRVLAVFNKNNQLSQKYPRQAGKPKRNPL